MALAQIQIANTDRLWGCKRWNWYRPSCNYTSWEKQQQFIPQQHGRSRYIILRERTGGLALALMCVSQLVH